MAQTALAPGSHATVADRLWGIVLASTAPRPRRWSFFLPSRRPFGPTPLRVAVDRAADLIPAHRLIAVLTRGRDDDTDGVDHVQRLVQPAYRGTAAELFLPVAMLARRDPAAIVIVLPAGGVGQDEPDFLATIGLAAETVATRPDVLLVIGVAPPCPRPTGWIEPGDVIAGLATSAVRAVRGFHRRPSFAQASLLQRNGGLVNTGVVVAQARTLLEVGQRRLPDVLETLEPLETAFGGPEERLLCEAIYESMPYADVSHALFAADEPFGVLAIPRTRTRVRPAASA